ncbi:alpha-D-ribose 1-methylphosphonate 5-triphosphate diphosphatase [Acidocella sp.]|uniref:alpha-D-ribose 1-methylphosphonate 5-triphosphate diphosphatase n=1 Tax=Acidocella sp. TaxID=50710 RepID=UPI003CFF2237
MTSFKNARLVLRDGIQEGGLRAESGVIAALEGDEGYDLEGDFLMPGMIDLHTDNLERQAKPRTNARWPSRSALLIHDSQCAAAGITTVFDALCIGDIGFEKERNQTFQDGYADLAMLHRAGALKVEHLLHLRCELPAAEMPGMLRAVIDDELVRLLSIMDHSPGIGGQYKDEARYRRMRAAEGFSGAEIDQVIAELKAAHHDNHLPNRALVVALARARGIPLASHDDHSEEDIARNEADGISIAEFPVSLAAAREAKARGMRVIAGAPNIVRGGSHSGNVSVLDLVRRDLLDALASDYVPASMLEAAFATAALGALSLPRALALVTAGPAQIAGLTDRGCLAPGLRADLLQVRLYDGMPVIRSVWREGRRVA